MRLGSGNIEKDLAVRRREILAGGAGAVLRVAGPRDHELPVAGPAAARMSVIEIDGVGIVRGPSSPLRQAVQAMMDWLPGGRLLIADGTARARGCTTLRWCPPRSYLVRVVTLVGPVGLRRVCVGRHAVRVRTLRVGDGLPLHVTVDNRHERPLQVSALLLVERHYGCRPAYRVNLESVSAPQARVATSKKAASQARLRAAG